MAANDWMPGATKMPVSWADTAGEMPRRGTKPGILVLHIDASGADAPTVERYFERTKVAASHFYVEYDGDIFQFQPISARSGADYGSRRTISVESQGRDNGSEWTKAQLNSLAAIAAWVHQKHGIKLRVISSSHPSQNGIGTHRFGCDGNFPTRGIQRGRLQRSPIGEKWSGARGKTCPSDERQAQLDDVVRLAKQVNSGVRVPEAGNQGKPKGPALLKVDGIWGHAVILSEQKRLDMDVRDGEYSYQNEHWRKDNKGLGSGWDWTTAASAKKHRGSKTIREDQERLKKEGHYKGDVDGIAGPEYFKAVQRDLTKSGHYDGKIDGQIDRPSSTVKGLQRRNNELIQKKWDEQQAAKKKAAAEKKKKD